MSQSDTPMHSGQAEPTPAIAVAANLRELSHVLGGFSDELYTRADIGPFHSTIGEHARHCLDHNVAVLRGLETGTINYEARERGTAVETNRASAIALAVRLHDRVAALDGALLARPIVVVTMLAAGAPAVQVRSTVARELAFSLSHTIHHNAIIAAMARLAGARVPERFGFAPSTIAYLDAASCAP